MKLIEATDASGEFIRRNIQGSQEGVEMIIDMQLIDVNTCEPVVDAMIDFWHCNATGVYSGVVANGNGDESDTSNLNATFLRGLQPTQYDGVAQFTTIFPGHYTSRYVFRTISLLKTFSLIRGLKVLPTSTS